MTQWGIDTLFNPGKRHMDEEKQRLQSTREEVGDASGGRRIDLESGTVTISRRGKSAPPDAGAAAEEDAQRSDQADSTEAEPVSEGAAAAPEETAGTQEAAEDSAAGSQKPASD